MKGSGEFVLPLQAQAHSCHAACLRLFSRRHNCDAPRAVVVMCVPRAEIVPGERDTGESASNCKRFAR